MANHLAIATVTEALRARLERDIDLEIDGVQVIAKRPDASDNQASKLVTLFLYRITPNAALRNADLPTRGPDPTDIRRRPCAALDLHYLLSFIGDEEELTSQRMLGLAVASLHSVPALTRGEFEAVTGGDPSWLADSVSLRMVESAS